VVFTECRNVKLRLSVVADDLVYVNGDVGVGVD
jgi:hypothetical protein